MGLFPECSLPIVLTVRDLRGGIDLCTVGRIGLSTPDPGCPVPAASEVGRWHESGIPRRRLCSVFRFGGSGRNWKCSPLGTGSVLVTCNDDLIQRLYGIGLALQITMRRAASPLTVTRIAQHIDQLHSRT